MLLKASSCVQHQGVGDAVLSAKRSLLIVSY